MKSLILIALMLISTNLFAQERAVVKSESATDQANHWMNNIASNSEMRLHMMQLMIDHTMDKPDEMMQLVDKILSNSEMKKMINTSTLNKSNNLMMMPPMTGKSDYIMKKTERPKKPIIKK